MRKIPTTILLHIINAMIDRESSSVTSVCEDKSKIILETMVRMTMDWYSINGKDSQIKKIADISDVKIFKRRSEECSATRLGRYNEWVGDFELMGKYKKWQKSTNRLTKLTLEGLSNFCSQIVQMDDVEIQDFLNESYKMTYNDKFPDILINMITQETNKNPIGQNGPAAINRLKTCMNLKEATNFVDKYAILIDSHDAVSIPRILTHIEYTLGSSFYIQELWIRNVDFKDVTFPLWMVIHKMTISVETIEFHSCNFHKNEFNLQVGDAGRFSSLKILGFYWCYPQDIVGDTGSTNELEILEIKGNQMKKGPDVISRMPKLRKLTINNRKDGCGESMEIEKLENLEELDISNNNIRVFPEKIKDCTKLRVLNVEKNNISVEYLLTDIKGLNRLEKLNVSLNKLKDPANKKSVVDMELYNLISLKEFIIRDVGMRKLSMKIENHKNLEILDISGNWQLENLDEICEVSWLKELRMSGCQCKNLPVNLKNITGLKVLDISMNDISRLPDDFGKNSGIEELNISGNNIEIKSVVKVIQELKCLKRFSIANNNNAVLKNTSTLSVNRMVNWWRPELQVDLLFEGLKGVNKTLEKLDISGNQITKVPEGIRKFKNVRELNVSKNMLDSTAITKLVKNLCKLNSLEILDMSGNRIVEMASKICDLKQLRILDVSNCSIEQFPIGIFSLEKLVVLLISQNNLKDLPKWPGKGQMLMKLDVSSNQFRSSRYSIRRLGLMGWNVVEFVKDGSEESSDLFE